VSTPLTTAVVDTNVLVSGFLNPHGPPGQIVEWLRSGAVRAGLDDRIVAEYEDVLRRPELDLPPHDVKIVLRRIVSLGAWAVVDPAHIVPDLPDPDDRPFAECARALGCALVTGNQRHFPKRAIGNLELLTPREFFEQVAGS
jgi:predicted nucleic acid-binding protein